MEAEKDPKVVRFKRYSAVKVKVLPKELLRK